MASSRPPARKKGTQRVTGKGVRSPRPYERMSNAVERLRNRRLSELHEIFGAGPDAPNCLKLFGRDALPLARLLGRDTLYFAKIVGPDALRLVKTRPDIVRNIRIIMGNQDNIGVKDVNIKALFRNVNK